MAEVKITLNEIIMNYIRPSIVLAFVMHFCVLFLTVMMVVSHTETEYVVVFMVWQREGAQIPKPHPILDIFS